MPFVRRGNPQDGWGISAVGSAQHWQCWGQEFESPMLHHRKPLIYQGFFLVLTAFDPATGSKAGFFFCINGNVSAYLQRAARGRRHPAGRPMRRDQGLRWKDRKPGRTLRARRRSGSFKCKHPPAVLPGDVSVCRPSPEMHRRGRPKKLPRVFARICRRAGFRALRPLRLAAPPSWSYRVISFLPLILKNSARAITVEKVRMADMAEATPSLPRMTWL